MTLLAAVASRRAVTAKLSTLNGFICWRCSSVYRQRHLPIAIDTLKRTFWAQHRTLLSQGLLPVNTKNDIDFASIIDENKSNRRISASKPLFTQNTISNKFGAEDVSAPKYIFIPYIDSTQPFRMEHKTDPYLAEEIEETSTQVSEKTDYDSAAATATAAAPKISSETNCSPQVYLTKSSPSPYLPKISSKYVVAASHRVVSIREPYIDAYMQLLLKLSKKHVSSHELKQLYVQLPRPGIQFLRRKFVSTLLQKLYRSKGTFQQKAFNYLLVLDDMREYRSELKPSEWSRALRLIFNAMPHMDPEERNIISQNWTGSLLKKDMKFFEGTFNAILRSAVNNHAWPTVEKCIIEMKNRRVSPTDQTIRILIKANGMIGSIDGVYENFRLLKGGRPEHFNKTLAELFTALLSLSDESRQLTFRMYDFLRDCTKYGKGVAHPQGGIHERLPLPENLTEFEMKFFQELPNKLPRPDLAVVNSLLRYHCKHGNKSEVKKLLSDLQNFHVGIDKRIYRSLFFGYETNHEKNPAEWPASECWELYQVVISSDMELSAGFIIAVIRALINTGQVMKLQEACNKMIEIAKTQHQLAPNHYKGILSHCEELIRRSPYWKE